MIGGPHVRSNRIVGGIEGPGRQICHSQTVHLSGQRIQVRYPRTKAAIRERVAAFCILELCRGWSPWGTDLELAAIHVHLLTKKHVIPAFPSFPSIADDICCFARCCQIIRMYRVLPCIHGCVIVLWWVRRFATHHFNGDSVQDQ